MRSLALVRTEGGEAERLELLKRHREEVRRALIAQQECLKLLDSKIDIYARRAGGVPARCEVHASAKEG